jgi:hypothetical protein
MELGRWSRYPYVNFENIVKCYAIGDKEILSGLFNEEEKENINKMIEENKKYPVYPDENDEKAKMWNEIQEGKKLNVILESDNGRTISNFTLQGQCERMYNEVLVLQGIDPKDCILGNPKFEKYLISFLKSEYISMDSK